MNKTYQLVWSRRSHAFIPAGEHARRRGRSVSGRKLLMKAMLAAGAFGALPASAGPTGGQVTHGSARIVQAGALTTVTQGTPRVAIDWNTFSSAAGDTITFNQSPSWIALNRVTGSQPSVLMGALQAQGQVFIINPNGVLFGQGASVNAGGLLASTLNMDSQRFFNGEFVLEGGGRGNVVNQGVLGAGTGGYIALAGPRVANEGTLEAAQGKVLMAAGDRVRLSLNDGSLLSYAVERGSLDALVQNSGRISASGGEVVLRAAAADEIGRAVVNHSGVIEAQTIATANGSRKGRVQLLGDMKSGQVEMAGTIDASAQQAGDGGFVETSAAQVRVADSARVVTLARQGSTGKWLLDPDDFVIAAGNQPGTASSIGAGTLSSNLNGTDVELSTTNIGTGSGDIHVDAAVSWTGATTLTLSASRNIHVNADIDAGSRGKLAFNYGQNSAQSAGAGYFLNNGARIFLPAGRNFTVRSSPTSPLIQYYVVTSLGNPGSITGSDLQGLANTVSNYVLGADIDAAPTAQWNAGAGFRPILAFGGTLDGLGHKISNLTIKNDNSQSPYAGLISSLATTGRLGNLTLENAVIVNNSTSAQSATGTLVGYNEGAIFNVRASANVSSVGSNVGGLVGSNKAAGTITGSGLYQSAGNTVSGQDQVGGLVGLNEGAIARSYAAGPVAGKNATGGLAGKSSGAIEDSYATGLVTGDSATGGLVGESSGSVRRSYASSNVSGNVAAGGLIGLLTRGSVEDSYAALDANGNGQVAGQVATGGLIGRSDAGAIKNSYAALKVTGSTVGGLVGEASGGTVQDSYWDKDVTGQAGSAAGVGKTTAEMRSLKTFAAWKIDDQGHTDNTWRIYEGQTMPLLRSFLARATVDAKSTVYNGAAQSGCSSAPCAAPPFTDRAFRAASGTDAGAYSPFTTQQGYDIKGGTLRILPADLALVFTAPEKVYDGNTGAPGAMIFASPFARDQVSVLYDAGVFDSANAGDRSVNFANVRLSGAGAANYNPLDPTKSVASRITPLELRLGGLAVADKDYDGNRNATIASAGTPVNAIAGDDVSVSAAGASALFDNGNAGTGKTVTVTNLALTGARAGNYTIAPRPAATASIRPLQLRLGGLEAADKDYDGSRTAAIARAGTPVNAIAGDDVAVSAAGATALFDDSNAGTGKTVIVSGLALTGGQAANYTIAPLPPTTATIRRLQLSLAGLEVADKDYDGNRNAAVGRAGTPVNAVAGDDVAVSAASATALFDDRNAGAGKTVTVSGLALTGAQAANYTIASQAAKAAIRARQLSLAGLNVADKVYDGGVLATVADPGRLDGLVAGDKVGFDPATLSARFADKNAGTAKRVQVDGYALTGDDAGNYLLAGQSATASIRPLQITLAGLAVDDKVYDGSQAAVIASPGAPVDAIAGDQVAVSLAGASALFDSRNAGTGKNVAVSGIALAGADAANYIMAGSAVATASIRPRPLGIQARAMDKTYDGNASASVVLADDRLAGDDLASRYGKAQFADGNAGAGKPVTVTGLALAGADAANYTVADSLVTTASIGRKPLTITANADGKAFDGKPYRGGNGVTYAGFANGEDASVLGGQLGYGGDAQGAVSVGSYRITPGGLDSINYASTFVDGMLLVRVPQLDPALAPVKAANSADAARAGMRAPAPAQSTGQESLRVVDCGSRLPDNTVVSTCPAMAAQGEPRLWQAGLAEAQ